MKVKREDQVRYHLYGEDGLPRVSVATFIHDDVLYRVVVIRSVRDKQHKKKRVQKILDERIESMDVVRARENSKFPQKVVSFAIRDTDVFCNENQEIALPYGEICQKIIRGAILNPFEVKILRKKGFDVN
jgi:hypothetical protein